MANIVSWTLKSKWNRKEHFAFCFGSIFPDLPVIVVGFVEWIKYVARLSRVPDFSEICQGFINFFIWGEVPPVVGALLSGVGYYTTAIWLRQCLHSVFFWILIILLAKYLLKNKKLEIFSWGAVFFHLLIDWPTHVAHAHKYFWPLINYPVPGFISHGNPWLIRIELGIWIIWIAALLLILLRRLNPKRY